jgi:predicted MFS family arabinose efflux permease
MDLVHGSTDREQGSIERPLVVLLAVACGAAVANLYYAQPLLHTLAQAFSTGAATAGLLITVSQIGFVAGLALLVPLGDLRERRSLITRMLLIAAAGMALAAAAPSFTVFSVAIAIVGTTSVVAQIVVPMSSTLAAQHERGRVVGTVMSGLLLGILLARTVSGLIAAALGWRTVFVFGACAMLALAATLRRALPRIPPTASMGYGALLHSIVALVREEPVLRQRMLMGAIGFGAFNTLWTSLAFLLSGAPYHYGNAVIGLFGLAGVAGATAASVAGRLADRGHGGLVSTAAVLLLLGSWPLLALGRTSVVALLAGIVLLDLGLQALHISNQSAIYALRADARSRLTTAYMVSSFVGGAVFSATSASVYAAGGWGDVCVLGAGIGIAAVAAWVITGGARRSRAALASAQQS